MLALSSPAICGFHAPITTVPTRAAVSMETKADLEALAKDLNPVVGYWDPLNLLDLNLWGQGEAATIGWFRESEIKHGRIAMAGFLGWITHSNNIRMQGMAPDVQSIPTGLSAPEVWDAMPDIAKWQIIVFVGVLDTWRENRVVLAAEGQTHYMKGGTPGYFPTFDMIPHPVPFNLCAPPPQGPPTPPPPWAPKRTAAWVACGRRACRHDCSARAGPAHGARSRRLLLCSATVYGRYDPFGVMKYKTEEQKARGRLVELNNVRARPLHRAARHFPDSPPFVPDSGLLVIR